MHLTLVDICLVLLVVAAVGIVAFLLRTRRAPPLLRTFASRYVKQYPNADAVIVFVHGVIGDAESTWRSDQTGATFPGLVADDSVFAGIDVYIFGYPSPVLKRTYTIDDVAEHMRLRLTNDNVLGHKEIILVAHSMGGLVVRAFVLRYREFASKIKFMYLFSTPTNGSSVAVLASVASRNPQLGDMYPMRDESRLASLQSDWLAANLQIPCYCAFEKQPTYGMLIVTRESATSLCTQRLDPIDADHINIVKPRDSDDTPFLALKGAFREQQQWNDGDAAGSGKSAPPSLTNGLVVQPTQQRTEGGTSSSLWRELANSVVVDAHQNHWRQSIEPLQRELLRRICAGDSLTTSEMVTAMATNEPILVHAAYQVLNSALDSPEVVRILRATLPEMVSLRQGNARFYAYSLLNAIDAHAWPAEELVRFYRDDKLEISLVVNRNGRIVPVRAAGMLETLGQPDLTFEEVRRRTELTRLGKEADA
jgi:pimeloyl-ACP methyl ester carboxylesterase